MHCLMSQGRVVALDIVESLQRRKLDPVLARRVESLAAPVANLDPKRAQEGVGVSDALQHGQGRGLRHR